MEKNIKVFLAALQNGVGSDLCNMMTHFPCCVYVDPSLYISSCTLMDEKQEQVYAEYKRGRYSVRARIQATIDYISCHDEDDIEGHRWVEVLCRIIAWQDSVISEEILLDMLVGSIFVQNKKKASSSLEKENLIFPWKPLIYKTGYNISNKKMRERIKPQRESLHDVCWRCGRRIFQHLAPGFSV